MGSFNIQRNVLRKTTGISEKDLTSGPPRRLRAIMKVKKPGYVPKEVEVRSRIDEELFTAEFDQKSLGTLEDDEAISSIAVSEKLDLID